MELLFCNYIIDYGGGDSTDWASVIASSGAVAVGLLALWYSNIQSNKALNAKKEEEKRIEIQTKLNEFYGPLYQLRKKSNLIYNEFRKKYADVVDFSTLTYLLNGNTINGNEAELLKEIIKIGEKCEELIHSKAGLIDDFNLRTNVIPRATTHFLILRLAHSGNLRGDVDIFKSHVFPKELDGLLEKRRGELEEELNELNRVVK